MDAFVSRKRKWVEQSPSSSNNKGVQPRENAEEESTDFKLALLASLHPNLDEGTLLEALLAADGVVEQASECLSQPLAASLGKRPAPSTVGYQSSLSSYRIVPANGTLTRKPLVRKGKTLFLYSPEDIEAHTPCSIIHNFLPAKQADALLSQLLEEASTYERFEFKLFDRVVLSPHTYSFYVNSLAEAERQKTEYVYNGGQIEVGEPRQDYTKILIPPRMFGKAYQKCLMPVHKSKKPSIVRSNAEYATFTPTAKNSSTNPLIHGRPTLLLSIVTTDRRRVSDTTLINLPIWAHEPSSVV